MRSFASVRRPRKRRPLPAEPTLARRAGLVFSGSAAALLLLVLTGCAPHLPEKNPFDSSAASPSSAAPGTVLDSGPHDFQGSATSAAADPLDLGLEAVRRFCRPLLPEAQWIAELYPLLTLEAASQYATVDPGRVQCSMVLTPARANEGDGFTRIVTVRTDRSSYRVVLSRSSLSAPWLVFRIALSGEK